MAKIIFLIVSWIVVFGNVKSEIEIDKLFHSNPPSLSPTGELNGPAEDSYTAFREPRHDEFDYSLTKKVMYAKQNENVVVSPFLVKLLLSMLSEAAGQDTMTHRELLTVLPSIRTANATRELYGRAFGSLLKESKDYDLNLGAKLFIDDFIHPKQRYAAIIQEFYHSEVQQLNFSNSDEAANIINAWCANATKNRINDIVSPDDLANAVILLMNTVYFNGYWLKQFNEKDNFEEAFFVDAKTTVPVTFMTKVDEEFYYADSTDLQAQVLRLPYKGSKFAMYIVLPYQQANLNEVIARIDGIHRVQLIMEKTLINKLALPKFKFTNTVKLNEILQTLGIRQMFTNQASFAHLVRGQAFTDRLQVSSVLQKTGIEVNEKGSTAFATTVVNLVNKFGGDLIFNANRPFLFLLEDETSGTLLFSGKVNNPRDL